MTEWCSRGEDTSPGTNQRRPPNTASRCTTPSPAAQTSGLAYDWVYPPRKGGEALIHVDWGNEYTLTKPYWLFRQWAEPLVPGMRVVECMASGPSAWRSKADGFSFFPDRQDARRPRGEHAGPRKHPSRWHRRAASPPPRAPPAGARAPRRTMPCSLHSAAPPTASRIRCPRVPW
jgi:hypothetical protein